MLDIKMTTTNYAMVTLYIQNVSVYLGLFDVEDAQELKESMSGSISELNSFIQRVEEYKNDCS